jgi:hypothetical protein
VIFKIRVRSLEQRQLQAVLSSSTPPPPARLPDGRQ